MRMKQRARCGYTLAELKEVWDRWKRQDVLQLRPTGVSLPQPGGHNGNSGGVMISSVPGRTMDGSCRF